MSPRGVDRQQLDARLVAHIVAEQFPEFDGQTATWLGEGWDNDTFTVGNDWVFRFPRRANRVPWQQREEAILATVAQGLGSLVPEIRYRGRASDLFPYPFIGYRLLEGVAADTEGVDLDHLALELADVFARLHAMDPRGVPPTPAGWEDEPAYGVAQEVAARASVIREALPRELRDAAEPWLTGAARPPDSEFSLRFCHKDICAEHVLVKRDGTLSGLIDWSDAMVTDPVVDFAGLITIAGWPFIRAVLAHYRLPVDARFTSRLRWLTRTLTLQWLADAVENHERAERQLGWVTRAFTTFEESSSLWVGSV